MSGIVGGRTFEELVRYGAQQAAAAGADVTDWNPLSVLRTLVETQAVIGERWQEELLVRLAEAIDTSTYHAFGFGLLAATKAHGVVTVSRTVTGSAQTVAAGSTVVVPNSVKSYVTLDALTLGVGVASGTTRVLATLPGAFGNTPAGSIVQLNSPPAGAALAVTNAAALVSGTDEETPEARRVRFADYVATLHRATPDAIAHAARTTALYDGDGNVLEEVRSAQVTDGYASATCYLWNGGDGAPAASADLVDRVQEVIDGYTDDNGQLVPGYKAAGVAVTAAAATLRPQAVTAGVYLGDGFQFAQVLAAVAEAIRGVFARQEIGDARLRLNDLRQAIGTTRGVIDHVFAVPSADVPGGDGVVIVPAAINIYQAN